MMRRSFILACGAAAALFACSRPEAPRNTAVTRDQHQVYFPINDDGGVHNVDCNVCHGAFDSFAQYTCVNSTCHTQVDTDSAHGLIFDAGAGLGNELAPGYGQYDPNGLSCYNCHSNGRVPPGANCVQDGGPQPGGCFDHTFFFLIRPGQANFANHIGPHDGCSPADVLNFWLGQGVDLSVDSQGLPIWATNVGYGVACNPEPSSGGLICAACHPDPNDHRTLTCLTCHPVDGLAVMHDAGIGFFQPIESGPAGCAGALSCHHAGGLGVRQ